MATTLHTVELDRGVVVDLFNAATAVPPIAAGSAGYIQNVSNVEVDMCNDAAFTSALLIGGKLEQAATSTLTFEAGDTVFLKTESRRAVLTVAIGS